MLDASPAPASSRASSSSLRVAIFFLSLVKAIRFSSRDTSWSNSLAFCFFFSTASRPRAILRRFFSSLRSFWISSSLPSSMCLEARIDSFSIFTASLAASRPGGLGAESRVEPPFAGGMNWALRIVPSGPRCNHVRKHRFSWGLSGGESAWAGAGGAPSAKPPPTARCCPAPGSCGTAPGGGDGAVSSSAPCGCSRSSGTAWPASSASILFIMSSLSVPLGGSPPWLWSL